MTDGRETCIKDTEVRAASSETRGRHGALGHASRGDTHTPLRSSDSVELGSAPPRSSHSARGRWMYGARPVVWHPCHDAVIYPCYNHLTFRSSISSYHHETNLLRFRSVPLDAQLCSCGTRALGGVAEVRNLRVTPSAPSLSGTATSSARSASTPYPASPSPTVSPSAMVTLTSTRNEARNVSSLTVWSKTSA
ncbi:hypothetical protein FB451DRAFT_1262063 [Mycena latifolia]|nr:hypothetical protein FB451DRAFT_1262063 [Mycena latifolia]